jgi:MFS transporter, SP family, general alpha glucoside:H+ symporter
MSDEKNQTIDIEHAGEHNGNFDRDWRDENWAMATGNRKLSVAAQEVAYDEKNMTTMQAIKRSKKAILWSLVISTCVIMEGYDTNLLGNFYAFVCGLLPSPTH